MTVSCPQCGREYPLPDGSSENKRIYFYCTQCSRKIVIDGRKRFLTGTSGIPPIKESLKPPVFSSIINSSAYFFDFTTIAAGFVFSLLATLILTVFSLFVFKNLTAAFQTPSLFIGLGIFFAAGIYYFYYVLLYFISKVRFYSIEHPLTNKLDWKFILFDLKDDLLALFIVFLAFPICIVFILAPIYILDTFAPLYAGLIFSIALPVFIFLILTFFFAKIIPAIIASRSLYAKQSIFNVFAFIKREFFNIPIYLFFADILTFFIGMLAIVVFMTSVFLFSCGIILFLDIPTLSPLRTAFSSIYCFRSPEYYLQMASFLKIGIGLFILFLYLFSLIIWSFIVNTRQSLISQACWIMNSNPGKSIPLCLSLLFYISFFAAVVSLPIYFFSHMLSLLH